MKDPAPYFAGEGMENYPTIEVVCKAAARVFTREAPMWQVPGIVGEAVVTGEDVRKGGPSTSDLTEDCRSITVHIIAHHVPLYSGPDDAWMLLNNIQMGKQMGRVSRLVIHRLRKRACVQLQQYEYQCMYYSILWELIEAGHDLWALPKNLVQHRRA